MKTFLLTAVLLVAGVRQAAATCDVTTFGALGDGIGPDQVAIQSAITVCDMIGDSDVYFPPGDYVVERAGSAYYSLSVPSGITLRGDSRAAVTLRQAAGIAASVRLLYITGDDVVIRDLTLDGNKANQSVSEHRHGIFADGTSRLLVERVTSQNFTGDGFYLYTGAQRSTFNDVLTLNNDRNGITMGSQVDGVILSNSRFLGSAAQQVDSEPGGTSTVNDVTITGCVLDGTGNSNDYVLTVSGPSSTARSRGWNVVGNTLNGPVFIVWAQDVVVASNHGVNPATKPAVTAYRTAQNIVVSGNVFHNTQTTVDSVPGIDVLGTGTGHMPERVVVADNVVRMDHPAAFGVRAHGAMSVSITGNTLRGVGTASTFGAGVYLRTTNTAVAFRGAVVSDNTISNFGHYGVLVNGNSTAQYLSLDISGNTFDDDSTSATMTIGIRLDDGTGAAQHFTVLANRMLGGVATPVSNIPSGTSTLVAGTATSSGWLEK
jgi:polygalacturonase